MNQFNALIIATEYSHYCYNNASNQACGWGLLYRHTGYTANPHFIVHSELNLRFINSQVSSNEQLSILQGYFTTQAITGQNVCINAHPFLFNSAGL